MKKLISILLLSVLTVSVFALSVSTANYPNYVAPYCATAPSIDGTVSSGEWDAAEWANISTKYECDAVTGSAKFKVMHDNSFVYVLLEVEDGTINEWDNAGFNFSDVRTEDAEGADIYGPNNTFSWRRLNENGEFLAEAGKGKNGDFGAPERDGANLFTKVDEKAVLTKNADGSVKGYLIEVKLEANGGVPSNLYFEATFGDANTNSNAMWTEYWGWNLPQLSTRCYGTIQFAAEPHEPANYSAPYCSAAPSIDGTASAGEWDAAEWANISNKYECDAVTGSAKFKVLHDDAYIYVLLEVEDGTINEWDNAGFNFSDLLSEDAAGADTYGPNNTFSWRRLNENGEFIAEAGKGKNGDFGAPERDGANLVTKIDEKAVVTKNADGSVKGYLIEVKLEATGGVPSNLYFEATFGDANTNSNAMWTEYWGWNLPQLSTRCYGTLAFAANQDNPSGGNDDGGNDDGEPENPGTFDAAMIVTVVAALSGIGTVVASKKKRF